MDNSFHPDIYHFWIFMKTIAWEPAIYDDFLIF